jgi:hypothetical protein
MIYAGIGSRETPQEILDIFILIGKYLGEQGYILRSGGAGGADSAFENGCDLVKGTKEIYLPWPNFNDNISNLIVKDPKAFDIAKQFHGGWDNLKQGAKKLHARNSHQVLGLDLKTKCDFVICYTPKTGGTNQALRIAKYYNIPIFNAYNYTDLDKFVNDIWMYIQQQ